MSDEEVGSLHDELRRLGIALGDWSAGREDRPTGHVPAASDPAGSPGGDEAEAVLPVACRSCPICQFIALAQGERTEALDGLLSAAAGLVTALTTYVEKQTPSARSSPDDEPPPDRVQRIDLA